MSFGFFPAFPVFCPQPVYIPPPPVFCPPPPPVFCPPPPPRLEISLPAHNGCTWDIFLPVPGGGAVDISLPAHNGGTWEVFLPGGTLEINFDLSLVGVAGFGG